jgi:hypothetical protein
VGRAGSKAGSKASSKASCSAHGSGSGGGGGVGVGDVLEQALVAGEVDEAVDVDDAGVEEGGLPKSELAMRMKEKFKCGRGVYLGDARDDTRRRRGDAAGEGRGQAADGGGRGARFDGLLPEALDALAPVGIEWSVSLCE